MDQNRPTIGLWSEYLWRHLKLDPYPNSLPVSMLERSHGKGRYIQRSCWRSCEMQLNASR